MNILRILIPALILMILYTACVDRIDLDIDSGGVIDIAIDAKLVYGDTSRLEVTLSEVFDFDGTSRLIIARTVELLSNSGESFTIIKPRGGVYFVSLPGPDTDMVIDPNQMYKLNIQLASGDMIETNFQNLERISSENKLMYETFDERFENDEGLVKDRIGLKFFVESTLTAKTEGKLKWEFIRTFKFTEFNLLNNRPINDRSLECWDTNFDLCPAIANDPDNILYVKDCDLDGHTNAVECDKGTDPRDKRSQPPSLNRELRTCYFSGFVDIQNIKLFDPGIDKDLGPVFTQDLFQPNIDFHFAEGYFMRLITESLNKETFDYFEKIEAVLKLTGSMFDPPAAKVNGNFTNISNPDQEVFGFFYITERDTSSVYISPKLVGMPDTLCLAPFVGPPPDYCLNCQLFGRDLKFEGIMPPEFWVDD